MEQVPIRLEIKEDQKIVILRVPWEQLSGRGADTLHEWLDDVARVTVRWESRGYACKWAGSSPA